METSIREYLRNQPILKGLNEFEIEKIESYLTKYEFESYEVIITEGDLTTDIYFLVQGDVFVLKWDDAKLFQLKVAKLSAGEVFGEMSFLNQSPRSTTIETRKPAVVYKLPREKLLGDIAVMQEAYNKIIANIASIILKRLLKSEKAYVKTLRSSLNTLQWRVGHSLLVIWLPVFIGLMNFVAQLPFSEWLPATFYESFSSLRGIPLEWAGWILFIFPLLYLIRRYHYELSEFGINKGNLKKGVIETPFFIVTGCLLVWILSLVLPVKADENSLLIISSPYLVGFYFIYCAAQEFIARGVLQKSLKVLFGDKKKGLAIILTALYVAIIPTFSGVTAPLFELELLPLIFLGNVLLGKIYFHLNNLYGVILIHFVVGLFANYLRVI